MFDYKCILRLKFVGNSDDVSFAHYIVSSQLGFPSSNSIDDLKEFLKSLPFVILSPESFDKLCGVDMFSICNGVEV